MYILGTTAISGGTKTLPVNAFKYLLHTLTKVDVETNSLDLEEETRYLLSVVC